MSNRMISAASALMIAGLLLLSVYLQVYKNILPCPLCTLQRFTFGILAFFFLLGSFVNRKLWQRIFINGCTFAFSIMGILLAGRQVYLQHFVHGVSEAC